MGNRDSPVSLHDTTDIVAMTRTAGERMILGKTLTAAIFAACCWLAPTSHALAASSTNPQQPKLASYDWSVKSSPNLAIKPPSMKILVNFLNSVLESAAGELDPDIGMGESDEEHAGYVCSFRFADLRGNGSLSLVVGLGVPNRPSCRDLYVIDKTASGFEVYATGGSIGDGGDVSSSIKDLKHDSHLEYVYYDSLATRSTKCTSAWPVIYAWRGDGYKNVSDEFKDFYRQKIDSLNQIIAKLQDERGPEGYDLDDKQCLEEQLARIKKFLAIAPNEGLDEAAKLAKSSDPAEREHAAYLLGGIGSPEAQKCLEALSKDSDAAVAYMGKRYLQQIAKNPDRPAEEFAREKAASQ
jgi:hypothetical protein